MSGIKKLHYSWRTLALGIGALTAMSMTGCTMDIGGQTLPSAYYLKDDVQYFPTGPEFPLAREAAVQKAYTAEAATRQR